MNNLARIGPNPLSPFAEPVAIPFQKYLVVRRHVFRYRTVLAFPSIQAAMGRDAVMVIENLNYLLCYPYIYLTFYKFVRNGV